MTYKSSHSRQELRLHSLPFRKTAANEDAVVSNLMRNLMSEARQCRSGADQGTRIERCCHAAPRMRCKCRNVITGTGFLTRDHLYYRGTSAGLQGHKSRDDSHIMHKVTKQVEVS